MRREAADSPFNTESIRHLERGGIGTLPPAPARAGMTKPIYWAGTSSSQPPVKPIRFNPRAMCGFLRIIFQTKPLR